MRHAKIKPGAAEDLKEVLTCHETKQRNFAFGWEELRQVTMK